jgi:hypothetical protein
MSTHHVPAPGPLALQPAEGEALWFMGFLATIKASAEGTAGRVAVIHHLGSQDAGSPLHVHHRENEWFYVLDGELSRETIPTARQLKALRTQLAHMNSLGRHRPHGRTRKYSAIGI